jgi:hypothetical protein
MMCPACGVRLGQLRYEDPETWLTRWRGGRFVCAILDAPSVPTGTDMATGLPSFGLRNRARTSGATRTQGCAKGRPPWRSVMATRAPRTAAIHCKEPKCHIRVLLDSPTTWPGGE